MYQLFGIKPCLTAFALACGALSVLVSTLWPPADLGGFWRIASACVSAVGLATYVVGQTPAFPWLCRLPGIRSVFPDIDGRWKGTIESNWPVIARRAGLLPPGEPPPSGVVPADFTVKARLFHVRINQTSESGYTTSKTLFVRVSRDPEDGEVRLNYIYEASTLTPEATDSDRHHGAAYLDLKLDKSAAPRLEGVYWTNRNWHPNALNTAGKIVLTRQKAR